MSELIAEARVLVTPDTSAFRALLEKQVGAATSTPVTVPVTPVITGAAKTAGATQAAQSATKEAAAAEAAINKLAAAELVLANADTKVLTSSSQAAAARSQFSAATRASVLIQDAYKKAIASEDEDLIALATSERVAAKERQNLALQTLRAAQATDAASRADKGSAATQQTAGATAAARSAQQVTASSTAAARANDQLARSAEIVAIAEKRAAASTTEVSAAQIRYQASISATAATFRAYQTSLETTDFELRKQARDAFGAAKANEALALSNLEVARTGKAEAAALGEASAVQTARLGQLSKGAGSAGAALAGLRGATLAAGAPFIAGAAGAIAFGKAIGIATSFNQQLNVFRVTVGATADEMDRVRASAVALGQDLTLPGVSAGDAAQAMTEFAKAGLSVNDAIAATRGGLQLATAAQLSNADAVELTASALNAFKLQGDQAVSVADSLANAANAAQGSIADIGLGLKQASGAAAAVGVSFQDTTALLTLLAKNGLTASDAGTALRTAFVRLVNPSKKAQEILKDLNIQLRDANGNVRPEVFNEFARAQQNLAKSTQQANAAIVFGQDAFRVIGLLGRENTNALDQTRIALDKQGTAADVAAARNVGLAGATANLKNQLETTGLIVGELASGPLTLLATQLATDVGMINDFIAALSRIPGEVPLPDLSFLPGDQQKQGNAIADHFKGALGFAAKRIALAPFGLEAQAGALVVERLFPPKDQIDNEGKLVGANLRSAIEDASRTAVTAATEVAPRIRSALDNAFSFANQQLLDAIARGRTALEKTIQGSQGQQLGLEDVFNKLLLSGASPAQQTAALQKQFATQQAIIDKATTGLTGLTSGDKGFATLTEAVRKARAKQVQIQGQITSINEAAATAGKQEAAKAQQAAAAADQSILDSFLPAEQRLDLREATAAATGTPQALLAAERARKQQLLAEIKQIQGNFTDTKNAAAIISQKRVQIATLDGQIDANLKAIFTEGQQARATALQSQVNLAAAEGNIPLQIRLNNILIAAINRKIASDKLVGAALNDAKTEREKLQSANQSLVDQQQQDQIALGQSILDLTGNQDPLVKALNTAIAADKKRIAVLKAAGKSTTVLQTQLNNLLKQRNEVVQGAKEEGLTGGTTLADLFKENQDIFRQAGNVGQNAANLTSRAQNAPIRTIVQHQIDIRNDPAAARAARQEQSTDRLIQAIDRLSDTLSGNGTTGGRTAGQNRNVWKGLTDEQRFFYQRTARQLVEQGLTG